MCFAVFDDLVHTYALVRDSYSPFSLHALWLTPLAPSLTTAFLRVQVPTEREYLSVLRLCVGLRDARFYEVHYFVPATNPLFPTLTPLRAFSARVCVVFAAWTAGRCCTR